MSFIPYATQTIEEEDLAAVRQVLTSDWLTQGPAVPAFESAFAAVHGVMYAVAVSNATAGLHLACVALGVGPGKVVWTTPNSFVASANCARYCGSDVDFVDIDPITRNMSVQALAQKLETAKMSGRLPCVVIPVHFSGLPCDLREMRQLADEYGFAIIADASHAVGATYEGAPVAQAYADVSVFSFHPVKIITTGEGGLLATQSAELAAKLQLLRSHGITREPAEMEKPPEGPWCYEQQLLGFNYRLTDIQAVLGHSQLSRLGAFQQKRERLAARYPGLLRGLPLKLPAQPADRTCSWHLYVVEVEDGAPATRAEVYARLRAANIGVNVHYTPIHLQPYYRRLGFTDGMFPAAEAYGRRALSIPLYPLLDESQQDRVAGSLREVLAR
ncbi:UDP-4-amino-4,6-dideoxy-N-acetyl-beta-L-altrosamine transaminase [Polaromonas sp.]|uniref:UDP-4-amino-4, 6-dideoxy-N-acetyl-beta-L-altrosamine transaminase n=1 Tax=Polaromonas sp. TaxID=1869339 RepID=UPI003267C80D